MSANEERRLALNIGMEMRNWSLTNWEMGEIAQTYLGDWRRGP
jgi:hypothetical protein